MLHALTLGLFEAIAKFAIASTYAPYWTARAKTLARKAVLVSARREQAAGRKVQRAIKRTSNKVVAKTTAIRLAQRYARIASAQRKLFRLAITADRVEARKLRIAAKETARRIRVGFPILRVKPAAPILKGDRAIPTVRQAFVPPFRTVRNAPQPIAKKQHEQDKNNVFAQAETVLKEALKGLNALVNGSNTTGGFSARKEAYRTRFVNKKSRPTPKGLTKKQTTNYKSFPKLTKVNQNAVNVAAKLVTALEEVVEKVKNSKTLATFVATSPISGFFNRGMLTFGSAAGHDPDAWVGNNSVTYDVTADEVGVEVEVEENAEVEVSSVFAPLASFCSQAQLDFFGKQGPIAAIQGYAASLSEVQQLYVADNFRETYQEIVKAPISAWLSSACAVWIQSDRSYIAQIFIHFGGLPTYAAIELLESSSEELLILVSELVASIPAWDSEKCIWSASRPLDLGVSPSAAPFQDSGSATTSRGAANPAPNSSAAG